MIANSRHGNSEKHSLNVTCSHREDLDQRARINGQRPNDGRDDERYAHDGHRHPTDDDGNFIHCIVDDRTGAQRRLPHARDANAEIKYGGRCCSVNLYKKVPPCQDRYEWKHGEYSKDDCGSGIVQTECKVEKIREKWCSTPLSVYQETIGELGRQLLCGEVEIPRKIIPAPPCNICETILPPCGGYYRKYDTMDACEEPYACYRVGQKHYRNKVERYWDPCALKPGREEIDDMRKYAAQNAYLARKLRTKHDSRFPRR